MRLSASRQVWPRLLAIAAIPLLLAGCSAQKSIATNSYPHVPPGYAQTINTFNAQPIAVWVHNKTILAVINVASADCPPVPVSITSPDPATIQITYIKSPASPCSVNLSPTTDEFSIPASVDTTKPVTVKTHFAYDAPVDFATQVHD